MLLLCRRTNSSLLASPVHPFLSYTKVQPPTIIFDGGGHQMFFGGHHASRILSLPSVEFSRLCECSN